MTSEKPKLDYAAGGRPGWMLIFAAAMLLLLGVGAITARALAPAGFSNHFLYSWGVDEADRAVWRLDGSREANLHIADGWIGVRHARRSEVDLAPDQIEAYGEAHGRMQSSKHGVWPFKLEVTHAAYRSLGRPDAFAHTSIYIFLIDPVFVGLVLMALAGVLAWRWLRRAGWRAGRRLPLPGAGRYRVTAPADRG